MFMDVLRTDRAPESMSGSTAYAELPSVHWNVIFRARIARATKASTIAAV